MKIPENLYVAVFEGSTKASTHSRSVKALQHGEIVRRRRRSSSPLCSAKNYCSNNSDHQSETERQPLLILTNLTRGAGLCHFKTRSLAKTSAHGSHLPASISHDALYAKRELWSSLPTCPFLHHGILRNDRSTTQLACLPHALYQSQRIGAPCFIASPLLSPLSLPLRQRAAVRRKLKSCPDVS
jgi:hypothetical protein